MKDIFGQELFEGDEVAAIVPGYLHLTVGKVSHFTAKTVAVEVTAKHSDAKKIRYAKSNQVAKHQGAPYA